MNVKRMTVAIFLIAIFAVGTLHFTETVEATKWKKFDSGTIKMDDGTKLKYNSYIKGNNKIHTKLYLKSKLVFTMDYVKIGSKIAITSKNPKGKVLTKETEYTKKSLKKWYYS